MHHAITDDARELARQIVVVVLREQESAWETVAQMVADWRWPVDERGFSMKPRYVWKRRKQELKQLAQTDCPHCHGRGLVAATFRSGARQDECACTRKPFVPDEGA